MKSGIPGSVLEFGPYRMTLTMTPVFSESGFAVPTTKAITSKWKYGVSKEGRNRN